MNKVFGLLFLSLLIISFPALSADTSLPSVVIVTTGGTIAEKADPKTGAAVPAVSGDELVGAVPGLSKIANIRVENFMNIDSSQMTPEIWAKLSRRVDEILKDPEVAGVVVTHGTDTMAVGAYFLELTLTPDKPVVFVGAMRDASDVSPDGPANLLNAVIQVCSKNAHGWGVTVTLNQFVNSARNVMKTETTNVQTFTSGEKGFLGYITGGKVLRYNDLRCRQKLPLPGTLTRVDLLTTFAGDDGAFIRHAVDRGAEGIVIEGVGAGNVNKKVFQAVQYALGKGVEVVVTSRVPLGGVYPIYGDEGGGASLVKIGAILSGDLKGGKARILLMLAEAKYRGDREKIAAVFQECGGASE